MKKIILTIELFIAAVIMFLFGWGIVEIFKNPNECQYRPAVCVDVRFGSDDCSYNSLKEAKEYAGGQRIYKGEEWRCKNE